MSRASCAPEPSPPLTSDAADCGQERLGHGAGPAPCLSAKPTPGEPRSRLPRHCPAVPTSAPRPIARFRARGGGPKENVHQSFCRRGGRLVPKPIRELVGGAEGVGSPRDLNLNGRPLTTAWSEGRWSAVSGDETTKPAAAAAAAATGAGDVRGAGQRWTDFLGQGAAEARAPSLDRCAWIRVLLPGRALAVKVNPGVRCLGRP